MADALPGVLEAYRLLRPGVEAKQVGCDTVLPCVNPRHTDRHPSLRVNVHKDVWRCDPCDAGGRSIALVIHSCKARNDAEALAWLVGKRPEHRFAREPETYKYRDESGKPLYVVERGAGKLFKQRRADGAPNLDGVRRVPYRLPELRAAIADGKAIVVVEGEKDVCNLVKQGYAATTNSGGSSFRWPQEWSAHFAGARKIVVIADCDTPGRKAASERAALLSTICNDVRILDLDPKRSDGFDASDLLKGDGADVLAKAIESAPRFDKERSGRIVRLVAADTIAPAETEYIVRPYIPRGEATWLEGVTKTGKTMLALDIIARITTGRPFVNGEPIERASVAVITCEDDPARTLVPRLIAAGADRKRVSFIHATENGEGRQVSFLADLPAIESSLTGQDVSLVFVDGTFGILGVRDATSYTEAYEKMLPFVTMVRKLNVGALIVRHVRKSAGSALDKGIGSVGFGALGRSTLSVALDPDDETRRIFAHAGNNVGPIGDSYAFTIADVAIPCFTHPVGRAVWGQRVEISADEAVAPREDGDDRNLANEFLYSTLREPMPASEVFGLADKQRISKRTLQRAARRLGVTIERRGFGSGSVWHPPAQGATIATGENQSRHSRRDETPGTNGANAARTEQLSNRGKVCRQCKAVALGFDCEDGTFVCRACSEDAA
jgi:putative DNA primase/helicase